LVGNLNSLLDKLNSFSRKGYTENDVGCSMGVREDEYEIALIDRGFAKKMPFVINSEISSVVRDVCNPSFDRGMNARLLFEWVVNNVRYGTNKRKGGYRNSVEVFRDREGVCGEMSMLYTTMVRSIGMRASYVKVDRDISDKEVSHACAMLDLKGRNGGFTLVDPAYGNCDIQHRSFRPLTDFEIFCNLNGWNGL